MISALACFLMPLAGPCTQYVRNAPRIADVAAHRAQYAGTSMSVTGRVRGLERRRSKKGLLYEIFSLCDSGCIHVYIAAQPPIHNQQLVTVRGTYYETFRLLRWTYSNEVEATEVLPRE